MAAHARGFASDNYAGTHPEVIDAIAAANIGHAPAYGDEGGAPEKVGGVKLLPVATDDGKLTPDLVAQEAWGRTGSSGLRQ